MPPDDPARTGPAEALAALRTTARSSALDPIRRRLDGLAPEARPWAVSLLLVLAIVAVVGVVWGVRAAATGGEGLRDATDPLADLPLAGTTVPSSVGPTPPSPNQELVVHAAGAVQRPGLLRLPSGSRVGDLVDAAGGTTADADRDRLNLAAPLADGARVYVPRVGEVEVPLPAEVGGVDVPAADGSATEPTIDLNRATASELEELPGVGPSIAAAIIDHREANGPFRSIDDLVDVRGIGPARLEQLRALVRV